MKGTISIRKGHRDGYKRLVTSHEWFNDVEFISIEDTGSMLILKKHYLDVPGCVVEMNKSNVVSFYGDIPVGRYSFDNWINEDFLIINYKQHESNESMLQ